MNNQVSLKKHAALIKEIEENLAFLESKFAEVKALKDLEVTDNRFNLAIGSFYNIFQLIPLMKTEIGLHVNLFRSRFNENKNVLFTKETEISYIHGDSSFVKAGRFNRPGQALFYATLPIDSKSINPSLTACLETCKRLSDVNAPISIADFTTSRWKVKASFYVLNMCFDDVHLKGNRSLNDGTQRFLKEIQNHFSMNAADFIISFFRYFSQMSGSKSSTQNEYYILTALFYAAQYYYKEELDQHVHGIIFPSAMTEGEGLNIVLTSDAVDAYLEVEKVMMYRFTLDRIDRSTYSANPCSDMVDIVNGKFHLTSFLRIPDNRKYE